jgi:hypothetical protein
MQPIKARQGRATWSGLIALGGCATLIAACAGLGYGAYTAFDWATADLGPLGKLGWGALCVTLTVAAGAGLGCGALYWAWKGTPAEVNALRASAEAFLDLVKEDQLEKAYAETSASFRSAQTLEEFSEQVKRLRMLREHTTRDVRGWRITNKIKAVVGMALFSPDNAMTFTLALVKADGRWRVAGLTVP